MKLSAKNAAILLALVISARATSFMFSKLCLTSMNTSSLIALRFSVASLILFLIFNKRISSHTTRHTVISGVIIGSIYYFVLACEHTGLKTTNASTASFIENLAIIIVPLIECIIAKCLPTKKTQLSAILAITGVACLTMVKSNLGFTSGECFLLAAAFLYAFAIIATTRLVELGDSFVIGFFQVTTTGLLSWINVAIEGSFTMPKSPSQYIMIFILAVVCTCFGFTLQPVAQSRLSSETTSSFCALGPLVASLLSCIFLRERFTAFSFAGAVLILLSLAVQSGLFHNRAVHHVE